MIKACLFALGILAVGCGSRSGLLSPDPIDGPDDGGVIVMNPDGGADGGRDAMIVDPPPPPPPEIEPAVHVAAGLFHTCAATRVGRIHCWGFNNLGQLGDGTTLTRREPVAHAGVNDALAIASGREHGCAIRGDRTVSCWGSNGSRQLGDGTDEFRRLAPVRVIGLTDVVEISAGGEHTCARVEGGVLYCWGHSLSLRPEVIPIDEPVVQVAGGYRHTCFVTASGRVGCWGTGTLNGVAIRPEEAEYVRGLPPVVSITSGDLHSCGVEASGRVWCWTFENRITIGVDEWGNPIEIDEVGTAPAERVAIDDAREVSAGHEFTCAVRAGGRVSCWGNNERGQLGDGGRDRSGGFVDPVGVAGAMHVSAGWRHACALQENGAIMCWGRNTEGQLGEGSTAENHEPVMAAVLSR